MWASPQVGAVNRRGEHKPRIYSDRDQCPASRDKGKPFLSIFYVMTLHAVTVTSESSDLAIFVSANSFTPDAHARGANKPAKCTIHAI